MNKLLIVFLLVIIGCGNNPQPTTQEKPQLQELGRNYLLRNIEAYNLELITSDRLAQVADSLGQLYQYPNYLGDTLINDEGVNRWWRATQIVSNQFHTKNRDKLVQAMHHYLDAELHRKQEHFLKDTLR